MKWTEGAYFAAWLNMLGNDERVDALYCGVQSEALKALNDLRNEYNKFREHEMMNNTQERA